MKLSLSGKIVLTVLCFGIALAGFMIKLPAVFRRHDTELHTLFYFLAAGFLNVLFVNRSLVRHVLIFVLLYTMGVGIEYAQEYSNSLVRQRIHGRYDVEDVKANLKGLVYFSVLWAGYVMIWYAKKSMGSKTTGNAVQLASADLVVTNLVESFEQSETKGQHFADPQDDQKLQMAIQLLTEIVIRDPNHQHTVPLRDAISHLKKIQTTKTEAREKRD